MKIQKEQKNLQRSMHHKLLMGLIVSVFLFGEIFFPGCNSKPEAVAIFGNHSISIDEFKSAYLNILKQPDIFDSPELREQFLDEMINRRLIANNARQNGMGEEEKLRYRIDAFFDKQLRDAHYRHLINPKINIEEDEIKKIYNYTKQRRKIRHLFLKTRSEADSVYQLLKRGTDWNNLARFVFSDSAMAGNGGSLGWVHWDQMEYDMAMTTFDQDVNTFSAPVKSVYGYHIIFVENSEIDLMVTESDFETHKDKIRILIEKKKGDQIAGEYITKMMEDVSIQVRPQIINMVSGRLKKLLLRKPTGFDQMSDMQLTPEELNRMEKDLWEYRNEIIVIIQGENLTVGKFVSMLNYIPYAALHRSFKTVLDYVIRDIVVTKEAQNLELENKYPFVVMNTKLYEEYLLQMELRKQITHSVTISDMDIQDYFEKYGKTVNPDEVTKSLHNRILAKKKSDTVTEYISNLRSDYTVKKNMKPIHSYYDGLKSNVN